MSMLVDYSRQAELDQMLHKDNTSAVVIGCGGIGFWVAIVLAMIGIEKIALIDGDTVDKSNLNRLAFPVSFVGFNKAIALRKIIKLLRPETFVYVIDKYIDDDEAEIYIKPFLNISRKMFVFDCTDRLSIQKSIYNTCKKLNYAKYIKLGYEGLEFTTDKKFAENLWDTGEEQTDYRTAQSNVVTSMVSAGIGVLQMLMKVRYIKDSIHVNLLSLIERGNNNG